VIVVVLLFLANLRAARITLTAIPLSLAAAVLALRGVRRQHQHDDARRDGDRHRRLVDDAIIDVENVVRRLRENRARPDAERLPAAAIVRDATLEIRSSIVFATIIIVLVFLPSSV
jgi:HME family heavy-metal exporter